MGMFSEAAAEGNAKTFERILYAAVENNDPAVLQFCKEHVYPKYIWEIGDTWGSMKSDPKLDAIFDDVAG
jgi:hypothetical protein